MASANIQCLVSLRPFKGIDTLSAGIDVQEGRARQGVSADPYRLPLALVAARGRVNLALITTGGVGAVVKNIAAYTSGATDQQIEGTTELGGVFNRFMYDPLANTQTALDFGGTVDTTFFSQAVQFGNVLYDNAGHQYSQANPSHTFLWHYPNPDPTTYAYTVTPTAGTLPGGPTGTATYYYARDFADRPAVHRIPGFQLLGNVHRFHGGTHYRRVRRDDAGWGDIRHECLPSEYPKRYMEPRRHTHNQCALHRQWPGFYCND